MVILFTILVDTTNHLRVDAYLFPTEWEHFYIEKLQFAASITPRDSFPASGPNFGGLLNLRSSCHFNSLLEMFFVCIFPKFDAETRDLILNKNGMINWLDTIT